MDKEQKAAVVEEITGQLSDSEAVFAVDYRGLTVPQAAELRTRLRDADARFRVVKNRLTKLAAEAAGANALQDALEEGPTALAFVKGDVALAAKAVAGFGRQHGILEFKAGLMEGAALDAEQFQTIARLPARDVLHGQFVGVMASPITGLTRGLASLVSGLAIQLKQIEEQGLVEGEAEPEPEAEAKETSTEDNEPGRTGSEAEDSAGNDDNPPAGTGSEAEGQETTADDNEPGGTGSEAEPGAPETTEDDHPPAGSGSEAEHSGGTDEED